MENVDRVKAILITHGHEDHIGGISHHLKHFNIPIIYGPPLAMSMLQGKMEDAGVNNSDIDLIEEYDFKKVVNKYDLKNYIISVIYQNKKNPPRT